MNQTERFLTAVLILAMIFLLVISVYAEYNRRVTTELCKQYDMELYRNGYCKDGHNILFKIQDGKLFTLDGQELKPYLQ